ncbi:MAG: hypothetical protein F6K36_28825 [Symploca sp. SIO3C6]|nr:hypothetical protein [Symploca sp. SIO3C6]
MADLSGTWLGTYWQRGVPTRFELTLLQGGNTLSGNILDDSYLGEASLTGEVIGRKINFIKRYITSSGHSVRYIGIVSEDQNFMRGQWQVDSFNSGNWEAHRSDNNLSINLETLRVEKVPASSNL